MGPSAARVEPVATAHAALTTKLPQCYILGRRACDDTADIQLRKAPVMRKLASLMLLVGATFGLGGCLATPAYTGSENTSRTLRTWDYEFKQGVEEIDRNMMFFPPSRSTPWQLR
jgi:hypothetical protein